MTRKERRGREQRRKTTLESEKKEEKIRERKRKERQGKQIKTMTRTMKKRREKGKWIRVKIAFVNIFLSLYISRSLSTGHRRYMGHTLPLPQASHVTQNKLFLRTNIT